MRVIKLTIVDIGYICIKLCIIFHVQIDANSIVIHANCLVFTFGKWVTTSPILLDDGDMNIWVIYIYPGSLEKDS